MSKEQLQKIQEFYKIKYGEQKQVRTRNFSMTSGWSMKGMVGPSGSICCRYDEASRADTRGDRG